MSDTFYGDYSKWNGACPADVLWPILCFRADSGYATDSQAANYWRLFKSKPHIRMALAYVVPVHGGNAGIMARLKALFGEACPPNLAVMIDEESGSGFFGPGDHSAELNELDRLLIEWTHDPRRDEGYANSGDWAHGWPSHRSSLKRVIASYGGRQPSGDYYAWQYGDGSGKYPTPAGYPAPHGLDMNVIHKPIDQILTDYGFGEDMPLTQADIDAVASAVYVKLRPLYAVDTNGDGTSDTTGTIQGAAAAALRQSKDLAAIHAELDQVKATVANGTANGLTAAQIADQLQVTAKAGA